MSDLKEEAKEEEMEEYKSDWQDKYGRKSSSFRDGSGSYLDRDTTDRLSPFNWRDVLLRDAGVENVQEHLTSSFYKQRRGEANTAFVGETEEEQNLKKWIDDVRANAEEDARMKLAERRRNDFRAAETRLESLSALQIDSNFGLNGIQNVCPMLNQTVVSDEVPLITNENNAKQPTILLPNSVQGDVQRILSDISNRVAHQERGDNSLLNASISFCGKDVDRGRVLGRVRSKSITAYNNAGHSTSETTSHQTSKESNEAIRNRIRERLKKQQAQAVAQRVESIPACKGSLVHKGPTTEQSQTHTIEQIDECPVAKRFACKAILDRFVQKRETRIKLKCIEHLSRYVVAEKRRLASMRKSFLAKVQRRILRRWKRFAIENRICVDTFMCNIDRRLLRRSFSSWRERAAVVQKFSKKWHQVRAWKVQSSVFACWKREARRLSCEREAAQFASERVKLAIQDSKATQFRTRQLLGACFFRWNVMAKTQRRFHDRVKRQKNIIHVFLQSVEQDEGVPRERIPPNRDVTVDLPVDSVQSCRNTLNDRVVVADSIYPAEQGIANREFVDPNTITAVPKSADGTLHRELPHVLNGSHSRCNDSICEHTANKSTKLIRREEHCQANIWAKERDARRSIMQARRDKIKIARIKRLEEETKRKEDEALSLLEKEKEADLQSKRKAQEAKREKIRAIEKCKEQAKLARLHYEICTLKRYGLKPWKEFLSNHRTMEKKASIFYRDITLRSRWDDWRQFVSKTRKERDQQILKNSQKAGMY